MIDVITEKEGYSLDWDVADENLLDIILPNELIDEFEKCCEEGDQLFIDEDQAAELGENVRVEYQRLEANGYLGREVLLDLYRTLKNAGVDLPEFIS